MHVTLANEAPLLTSEMANPDYYIPTNRLAFCKREHCLNLTLITK